MENIGLLTLYPFNDETPVPVRWAVIRSLPEHMRDSSTCRSKIVQRLDENALDYMIVRQEVIGCWKKSSNAHAMEMEKKVCLALASACHAEATNCSVCDGSLHAVSYVK